MLAAIVATLATAGLSAEPTPAEREPLAVLRSTAGEAEKAAACKRLAVVGSPAAAGDLAALLSNPHLASWARIALEAIPGAEVDAKLRTAAGTLSGRLLVGVINTIGIRRDPAALPLLEAKLADGDADVAAAAAAALARIGTPAAAAVLAKAAAGGRDAMVEACLDAAEQLRLAGDASAAIAACEPVRGLGDKLAEHRLAQATRTAILARGPAGLPLLLEALRSPSRRLFNMALFVSREVGIGRQAEAVDLALVDEAKKLSGERAGLVLASVADRNSGGAGEAIVKKVLELATGGDKPVRVAAVAALGRIGNAAVIDPLLVAATDADAEVAAAAREAAAILPGEAVDRAVLARLASGDSKLLPVVAGLVGARRIAAVKELAPLVAQGDAAVRTAARESLGAVVDLPNLGVLIDALVQAPDPAAAAVAAKPLRQACVRMADREACAEKLVAALSDGLPVATKIAIYDTLGDVGGRKALAAVAAAGKSSDAELQDAATRLLGKWMTPDAAAVLVELSRTLPPGKYQTRAVRGAIRIARQFAVPDNDRADICRQVLKTAEDAADRKAVLEFMPRYPSPAMLEVAREAEKLPGLEAEAKAAAAAIAQKLPKAAAKLRSFDKQTLTERFVAEGCALADFDRDGHVDLTAGNSIWYGPEFTRRVDFTPPANNPSGMTKTPYDPASGYSDYFLAFAHDFTGDSWPDILVYGLPGEPAYVFVNPAVKPEEGKETAWAKHAIFDTADGESPDLLDVTGDGRPELLVHSGGQLGYAEIDWSQPLAKATFRPITPKTPENDKKYFRYTHGSGAGDVNGDGRIDLVMKEGWFEHPAADAASPLWPFHPGPFCAPGSGGGGQMYVYDVNGDGRNDVIASYNGHGFGLGWFEQRADGSFAEHRIMGATAADHPHGVAFSQVHALRLADFDGDGLLDILTGKRRWAHGIKGDPEPNAPPVLYWFRLARDGKGGATFEPQEIDADSGVGTQVTAGDVNKDGKPDVVVANKRGVFVFRQR
ncbi:MAG: FG-GAP repeat domain-containing protein [Planctomycetia bacterium]